MKFPLNGFNKIIDANVNISSHEIEDKNLYDQVQKSLYSSSEERQKRLSNIKTPYPESYIATIKAYHRNPDVIAEALIRASGICEECGSKAPFKRASDGSPYLEVHHVKRMADGGEDTVENTRAVCPNFHRKLHFG